MTVLERSELEASPLADLHAIANQLGLEGFRRLRKAELIAAILGETGSGGDAADAAEDRMRGEEERAPRARRRRPSRSRRSREEDAEDADEEDRAPSVGEDESPELVSDDRRRHVPHRSPRTQPALAPGSSSDGPTRTPGRGETDADGPQEAGAHRRRRGRGAGQRLGVPARRSARALRRGRLHLRRPGAPLRARLRRPRHRARAHAAPLRALPVAGSHRHDQRRVRGHRLRRRPLRRAARRLAARAARAGFPGPDARGDRVADPARPGLARGDRRRAPRGQDRDAAPRRWRRSHGREELDVSLVLAGARPEEIAQCAGGPGGARRGAQLRRVRRLPGSGGRARARRRQARGRARRQRAGRDRQPRRAAPARGAQGARRGAQPARRRLADGDRDRRAPARRRDDRDRARRRRSPRTGQQPILDLAASGTLKPELLVGEDGAEAITRARAAQSRRQASLRIELRVQGADGQARQGRSERGVLCTRASEDAASRRSAAPG